MQVEGWAGYVLKEKLKIIKFSLREWYKNHNHNIPGKIDNMKARLAVLDEKGEVTDLGDNEVEELHGLSAELHSLSQIHSSICWQQSRLQWLQKGDANSKKFHGTMSTRRRVNHLSTLEVSGVCVDDV